MALRGVLQDRWLLSVERQAQAGVIIGGRSWSVSLSERSMTFDDGPTVGADLLGSVSEEEGVWLWAWANASLDLPDGHLDASRRVSERAGELGAGDLTSGRVPLGELVDAHAMGAIGVDLLDAGGYFVAPHGPFQVVLALRSPLLALPALDGGVVSRTVMGGLGAYGFDHRAMIAAYLSRRGAVVGEHGDAWDVGVPSGERVVVRFDELGRCTEVDRLEVRPHTAALEVTRQRAWRDGARRYRVVVDGVDADTVRSGATARIPVAAGVHTVQVALDWTWSPTLYVVVPEGGTVQATCRAGGSGTDGWISLTADGGDVPGAVR